LEKKIEPQSDKDHQFQIFYVDMFVYFASSSSIKKENSDSWQLKKRLLHPQLCLSWFWWR